MTEMLGLKNRLTGVVAFLGIAVPIYLVGCLGLRVIGLPAILGAIFRPNRQSGLRFVLAFFVVLGLLIALTYRLRSDRIGTRIQQQRVVSHPEQIRGMDLRGRSPSNLISACR